MTDKISNNLIDEILSDVKERNGQVADNVDGIVVDVLRQQGEDRVCTHNDTDPDTDLQVGVLFVGLCTFFVKQLCSTP